jgi:tight adherence protein B
MLFGQEIADLAFIAMVAAVVLGLIIAVGYPYFTGGKAESRLNAVSGNAAADAKLAGIKSRLADDAKDGRRKQLQDTLKQAEEAEKKSKKRKTIAGMIEQSGLELDIKTFWLACLASGFVAAAVIFLLTFSLIAPLVAFVVGMFGLPRWFLGHLCKRRQAIFINDFADAIDVMVRGLKSGLPVAETVKIISTEMRDPVGPEFVEVVEGQKIGISIDQGIERMAERVPLAEVNFLAIVMAIQSKTGGNLSEALTNLSRVLRERKKMKAKVKSVSQEAKSSAIIIGALPFFMVGAMYLMSPDYVMLLFTEKVGNIALAFCAVWMTIGMLTMKKMINFEI